jgi:RsiW-degrading membrane proteinase PrsW (M82 family)
MASLVVATVPVLLIIIFVYVKDKYEKEPKKILLKHFLLGAFVSVFISFLLYFIVDFFFPNADEYSIFDQFVKAFFVVGLIEEFSKYIIVLLYGQRRSFFNEPFDGIIYCVMVSMGFAFVEYILYVIDGGLDVAILRAFTAIPAHATFAIIMGYFMGKAKFSNKRVQWNLLGLVLAISMHGAYNFFIFINFIPGISIGALISLALGIILSLKAIKSHQKNSNFKFKKSLPFQ